MNKKRKWENSISFRTCFKTLSPQIFECIYLTSNEQEKCHSYNSCHRFSVVRVHRNTAAIIYSGIVVIMWPRPSGLALVIQQAHCAPDLIKLQHYKLACHTLFFFFLLWYSVTRSPTVRRYEPSCLSACLLLHILLFTASAVSQSIRRFLCYLLLPFRSTIRPRVSYTSPLVPVIYLFVLRFQTTVIFFYDSLTTDNRGGWLCTLFQELDPGRRGGDLVAEWLACWTQAQKGPGSNRSRDAVG